MVSLMGGTFIESRLIAMLGRTHMAIGLSAAALLAPEVLHTSPIAAELSRTMTFLHVQHPPQPFVNEVVFIIAAAVGSLLPDLDQQDSLAARKVERLAHAVMGISLLVAVFLLHLWTSPMAWITVVLLWFGLASRANAVRKIALFAVAIALFYAGVSGRIGILGACLSALWTTLAALMKHRTFTHSLLGAAVFIEAVRLSAPHVAGGAVVFGLGIGYVLHIVSDMVAGGTTLLWPIPMRIGWPLVKTSGRVDRLLGGVALVLFVLTVVGFL